MLQLWFKYSVISASELTNKLNDAIQKCVSTNSEYVCKTCYSSLKNKRIPKCSVANKMSFPNMPSNFSDITPVEWRLVSPRLIFQKLQEAPRGKQLKINGNVVNVPADVAHTASILPRMINDTNTIKMQLKRRLSYKHSVSSENIRSLRVLQIAEWLINNCELYKQ